MSANAAKEFLLYLKDDLILKQDEAELGIIFQDLSSKRTDNPEACELATHIKQCKVDY